MRLIDAENLMTVTDIREDGTEITYVPYSEIESAPTAYDPDKVVEQLEKEFKKYYGENWNKAPYLIRAIEIVKGGGVDVN